MADAKIRSPKEIRTDAGVSMLTAAAEAGVALQTAARYELNANSVRVDKKRRLDAVYARLAALRAA
jgi:transcriptional regulator with XRE-family HTH domain